jgi:hypothetical protein
VVPGAGIREGRHWHLWRGAALTLAPRPDGISPYHMSRLENVKAGGSRELPSAML